MESNSGAALTRVLGGVGPFSAILGVQKPPRTRGATVFCACLLGLLPPYTSRAADLRPELEPVGVIEHLSWTPAGDLWFGTDNGQVYVSRDGGRSWTEIAVSPRRARNAQDSEARVNGDAISRVPFFDAQRGLALGYLRDREESAFRTVDGGATWRPVRIARNMLVKDSQVTPDGRAWIVGSAGEILSSKDFGVTWRRLQRPSPDDTDFESVRFLSPVVGVVAAQGLYLTTDGGDSWHRLPDPFSQGILPESTDPCDGRRWVETVRLWSGWIFARQCQRWFASRWSEPASAAGPPAEPLAWRPLRVGGRGLIALEPVGDRALAITEEREVVYLDAALQLASHSGFILPSPPIDVAVQGKRIAILDRDRRVTVGEDGSFTTYAMLGQGTSGRAPVFAFDRAADGSLWGVSPSFLYRSRDVGRTWERQAGLPQPAIGLALRSTGEAFLWNRRGWSALYDPRSGSFSALPGLAGLDVVCLFRRGDLWLVHGGLQQETMGRVEVIRAFAPDQFEGSAGIGFVAVSTDGGGRWLVVDKWPGSGPQALFLADDNTLTVLSWLGSVRRGKLTIDENGRPSAEMATVFQAGTRSDPYVQDALWLDFLAGEEGWVRGWVDHVGNFLYHSTDGGRSWELFDEPEKRSFSFLNRLGSGVWLAQELPPRGQDDRAMARWDGRDFRPEKRFSAAITRVWTDSTGGLLVALENGALWSLDANGSVWARLR